MKTRLYTNKYINKKLLIQCLKDDLKYYKNATKEYKNDFNNGYVSALKHTIDNLKDYPCDEVNEVIN